MFITLARFERIARIGGVATTEELNPDRAFFAGIRAFKGHTTRADDARSYALELFYLQGYTVRSAIKYGIKKVQQEIRRRTLEKQREPAYSQLWANNARPPMFEQIDGIPKRFERVAYLLASGHSQDDIARIIKRDKSTVSRKVRGLVSWLKSN